MAELSSRRGHERSSPGGGVSRRTFLRRGVHATAAAAGLALVGCGGGSHEDEPDAVAPVADPASAAGPAPRVEPASRGELVPNVEPAPAVAPGGERRRLLPDRRCDACTIEDPEFEPLPGARARFGIHEGAAYRMEAPQNWNGTLVLWAHGFPGLNDAGTDYSDVLRFGGQIEGREELIRNGVAWVASTYGATGYVPAAGVDDLLEVKDLFAAEFGALVRSFCAGGSMGGATAQLMAQEFPEEIDGAVALCGALSNVEVVDYIFSWHALALWFLGAPPERVDAASLIAWAAPLGTVEGSGELRLSAAGRRFAAVVRRLTGGERWGFEAGLADHWRTGFGLGAVYWPAVLATGLASTPGAVVRVDPSVVGGVDTRGAVYGAEPEAGVDEAALNAEVLRLTVDAADRRDPALGVATGRLGVPLLTLKSTGDLWTPISLEASYRARVRAAGDEDNLVTRAVRRAGHCNFSPQEVLRAILDLQWWVESGERPAGDDLSGDLRAAGVAFTNPFDRDDPLAP